MCKTVVKTDRRHSGYPYFAYFLPMRMPFVTKTIGKANWSAMPAMPAGRGITSYAMPAGRGITQELSVNFHDIRAWCWETWGPSKGLTDWIELESSISSALFKIAHADRCQNRHWCWLDDPLRKRIMFASVDEVALYKLTYGI